MARRRLHAGPRASATGQRRRALPPPPSILGSLRRAGAILLPIRRDEWLEVTVHRPLHVADLQLGAVIRALRIRLEHVRPDLVAPGDVGLRVLQLALLLLTLLQLPLVQRGA